MKHFTLFLRHIKHFLHKNSKDNISAIAGQSSFFAILSFVPFLLFAVALLSYFNIPAKLFELYILDNMTGEINNYVKNIIYESYTMAGEIAFTSAIFALWTAGKAIYSVTQGIFVIYKCRDKKNWFFKRLEAALYTLIMFVVLVLSVGVLVVMEVFSVAISEYIHLLPHIVDVLYGLRYIIMFLLVIILLAFALKLLLRKQNTDKKYTKIKNMLPGITFTAISWTLLSLFISIYIKYFGGFSFYGRLGTAAVVMIWLYFAAYCFLCGIQFNYIYRKEICNFKFKNLLRKKNDY